MLRWQKQAYTRVPGDSPFLHADSVLPSFIKQKEAEVAFARSCSLLPLLTALACRRVLQLLRICFGFLEVRVRLLLGGFLSRLGVCLRRERLDRFSQTHFAGPRYSGGAGGSCGCGRSGHAQSQARKRNVQVMADVNRGYALPKVLEAGAFGLQVRARRDQPLLLQLRRQGRVQLSVLTEYARRLTRGTLRRSCCRSVI